MFIDKFKIVLISSLLLVMSTEQSCSSNQNSSTSKENKTLLDSTANKVSQIHGARVSIDSLPIYAETKVKGYELDSMIAEVTFINNWTQSIWLYKPILPTDSLIENSFVLRFEKDAKNVPHIPKKSSHKYIFGNQDLFPCIIPLINENSLLELMPGTKIVFTTNLSKHYDFKSLDRKSVKAVYVRYTMDFPYIKDKKQVLLTDPRYSEEGLKHAYIHIKDRDYEDAYYRNIGFRVVLPYE